MKLWDRLWPHAYSQLPSEFVYFCALRVWLEATTPPYGDGWMTVTVGDAIARFAERYAIRGHGKDENYYNNPLYGWTPP